MHPILSSVIVCVRPPPTGTGSAGQVNGTLSSIPSPTMPHSFGLATAGSANGQSGPAGGGPDPTAVYTNGLAQAYPARELTSKQIAHGKQIPKNSNKKKKKTPTLSTRTAHLISFSPFHWLIIFIHSFLSFLIYLNFFGALSTFFPSTPRFLLSKKWARGCLT